MFPDLARQVKSDYSGATQIEVFAIDPYPVRPDDLPVEDLWEPYSLAEAGFFASEADFSGGCFPWAELPSPQEVLLFAKAVGTVLLNAASSS